MNELDLFSGCGGFSYGFLNAGFDVSLGVDSDPISLETYAANHNGTTTLLADIGSLSADTLTSVAGNAGFDVVIGGPPCQGVSLSGPRNSGDFRNRLLMSFARLVSELQPKAFVMENVPGLLSLFGGKLKNSLLQEFRKAGFETSYSTLMAADFGVPQLRKRVFIVGVKRTSRPFVFPDPTHFDPQSLFSGDAFSYVTCRDALSDLPSLAAELGREVQEYASFPSNSYQSMMRRGSDGVLNHIAADHSDKVRDTIKLVPEGGNYKDLPEEHRNPRNFHVAWTRYHGGLPAPTVDTGHRHHFHYKYDRVPTVRENARLQSFPDIFVFRGTKTNQFRHVGNAVPPLLASRLAWRLKDYL